MKTSLSYYVVCLVLINCFCSNGVDEHKAHKKTKAKIRKVNPVRKFGRGFKPLPNYNEISSPPSRTGLLSNGVNILLLLLFVALLIIGVFLGEVEVVIQKATTICLSCIGIG